MIENEDRRKKLKPPESQALRVVNIFSMSLRPMWYEHMPCVCRYICIVFIDTYVCRIVYVCRYAYT